ncbi:hypothetical protein GSI_11901 [Ganoderma sinense ZZ0214-1]|uniref:Uncharacterized protein n=1 Tax=Ganoderma sinense ZZ0214-1 TaxID=1077348 RepID=A0A2G8RXA2_9APHY|nr:hypothetical protein GSI_11901 [Ganoderma sinense ZZ0214-1]
MGQSHTGARSNSATPPPAGAAPLSTDHSKAEAGGYAGSARNGYTTSVAACSKPWYKTRKGLIIIFVAAIVVVAAVVGGAVGGTVGHKSNNNTATPSVGSGGGAAGGDGGQVATKTSTGTGGGGGGGPATTASSPAATTSSNSGGGGGGGGGVGNIVNQETVGTEAHAQPTAPSVADAAAGAGVV